jgi:hypothetical protein
MAALVSSYVERPLDGTCSWMATQMDLTDDLLQRIPVERRSVSACTGAPIVTLLDRRTGELAAS